MMKGRPLECIKGVRLGGLSIQRPLPPPESWFSSSFGTVSRFNWHFIKSLAIKQSFYKWTDLRNTVHALVWANGRMLQACWIWTLILRVCGSVACLLKHSSWGLWVNLCVCVCAFCQCTRILAPWWPYFLGWPAALVNSKLSSFGGFRKAASLL